MFAKLKAIVYQFNYIYFQSDRDEAEASDDDIFNPDDEELLSDTLAPSIPNISKDGVSPSESSNKSSKITDSPKEVSPDGNTPVKVDEATCDIKKTEATEKNTEGDKSSHAIQNSVKEEIPGHENNSSNINGADDSKINPSNTIDNGDNTNKSTVRIKQ